MDYMDLYFDKQVLTRIYNKKKQCFGDMPYVYHVSLIDNKKKQIKCLAVNFNVEIKEKKDTKKSIIFGSFKKYLDFEQIFIVSRRNGWVEEKITIKNNTDTILTISDINLGFRQTLESHQKSRLIAVPFRINADGKVHDYSSKNLMEGNFSNSNDDKTPWADGLPKLSDREYLRSEAWLWQNEEAGLLVAKYNNADIEMSVAKVGHTKKIQSIYKLVV